MVCPFLICKNNNNELILKYISGNSRFNMPGLNAKLRSLDHEIAQLNICTRDLKKLILCLESRVGGLEVRKATAPCLEEKKSSIEGETATPPLEQRKTENTDIHLPGSDEEKEEKETPKTAHVHIKKYEDNHPTAHTSVLLEIMPCDEKTDKMLEHVKSINMDGLHWGDSRREKVANDIEKVTLMCTVEDAKVSISELAEKMESFKDFIRSVKVSAMNTI